MGGLNAPKFISQAQKQNCPKRLFVFSTGVIKNGNKLRQPLPHRA